MRRGKEVEKGNAFRGARYGTRLGASRQAHQQLLFQLLDREGPSQPIHPHRPRWRLGGLEMPYWHTYSAMRQMRSVSSIIVTKAGQRGCRAYSGSR